MSHRHLFKAFERVRQMQQQQELHFYLLSLFVAKLKKIAEGNFLYVDLINEVQWRTGQCTYVL